MASMAMTSRAGAEVDGGGSGLVDTDLKDLTLVIWLAYKHALVPLVTHETEPPKIAPSANYASLIAQAKARAQRRTGHQSWPPPSSPAGLFSLARMAKGDGSGTGSGSSK